jgi:hypothetical protein
MKVYSNNIALFLFYLPLFIITNSNSQTHFTNVKSITFWELSYPTGPIPYTFITNSNQMTYRFPQKPNETFNDFIGWNEFYDVFFSDENGNYDLNGKCITIEAVFDLEKPYRGGLNICEVQLNLNNDERVFASKVTNYNFLGSNGFVDSLMNIVDGNLMTCCWMGSTLKSEDRLSITVGFSPVYVLKENYLITGIAQ